MTLHVLSLGLVTLYLVQKVDVCSLVQRGGALICLLTEDHTIVTSGHKHVPFLGGADWGRAFGDVWEMRQLTDVVGQAACLRVVCIAVGVTVFLLDVPS